MVKNEILEIVEGKGVVFFLISIPLIICSQRRPSEFTLETRNSTVTSSPRPCEHGMEQVFKGNLV